MARNAFGDEIGAGNVNAFGDTFVGGSVAPAHRAQSIGDAIWHGLQSSATGLALRGEMPEQQLGEDAPWQHRIASGGAGMVADLPLSIVGAVGGAVAGAAVSGPGAPVGAIVGGGAGAFGVPMALRDALVEAYSNNYASSWQGVWEIAKAAMKGGVKGAVIGGATAGAGSVVARTAMGAIAPSVGTAVTARGAIMASEAAAVGTELATLTATSAALEGRMPTWQDFMDNAILLGGMKAAVGTATKLRNIYAETGRLPDQVVADALQNPALKADLAGEMPPVPEGHVRLYRGQPEGEFPLAVDYVQGRGPSEAGRWFTADPNGTSFFGPKQLYVDVPKAVAAEAFGGSQTHPETGHLLPAEWANKAAPVPSKGRSEIPAAYQPVALAERVKAALDVEHSGLVADVVKHAESLVSNKPAAPVKPNIVRYEYITDKATAESVVREVATKYAEHVETQRRGTVATEASFAEGKRLIEEGELKPQELGRAANDGEVVARAILTKGAAERARSLAEDIAATPVERITLEQKLALAGALDQVRMFYGELTGAGAEAGRALRMLREIKRNPDRLGDAEAMLKAYEAGKGGKIEDIAALARTIKSPEGMRAFAEKVEKATTFEMVLEGWKAGILSGIHTTGANVIGNTARWTVETALTNPLTQTIEAARLAIKGDPMSLAVYKARVMGPLIGVQLGAADSLKIAAEVWKQKGEHLEKADVYKTAIPGTAGDVIRAPFRFLQVQDAFFRTFAEREKAYTLATERAAKEGFSSGTREFNEAVQRYTDKPTLGLTEKAAQELTKKIEAHGAESVFAQRLGPRMETMSRAIQGSVAEFVFPFRRTPVNLVSWSMQYTPLMNLMSTRWWSDFKAGGELQSRALARVAIGTGLALTAYELAEDGILTGSGLFDTETNRTKRGAGWQPNSLKIGDQYYSIERIEPVAKVLITAANLYEMQKSAADKADKAKLGAMAVALFANATISTTYMSGMSNAMAATKEPNRYMDSFLEQYATSLVPKIIGQTVTAADPHKREVDGVLEAIQSQLPYFRSKLLPARDVWGEPSQNDKWFFVLPVNKSTEAKDKVKTEAARLAVGIADVPKFVVESGPLSIKDRQVPLTAEQRDIFRSERGKVALEILAPIVNHPDWERIPEFAQAEIIKDAFKDATKLGVLKALPPDAAERQAVQQKQLERIIKETQQAQGAEKK